MIRRVVFLLSLPLMATTGCLEGAVLDLDFVDGGAPPTGEQPDVDEFIDVPPAEQKTKATCTRSRKEGNTSELACSCIVTDSTCSGAGDEDSESVETCGTSWTAVIDGLGDTEDCPYYWKFSCAKSCEEASDCPQEQCRSSIDPYGNGAW